MITVPQRLGVKSEVYKRMIEQYDADIRVCSPGIIYSFDPVTMTAEIQLAIKEAFQIEGVPDTKEIPLLGDVPIICIGGGDWLITMPIKKGDECLVFFGDTCIDSWWQNGCDPDPMGGEGYMAQEPMSLRRHDLSDGFALVGPFSQIAVLQDYSEDSIQIRNFRRLEENGGESVVDTKIDLADGLVTIEVGDNTVEVDDEKVVITVGSSVITVDEGGVTIVATSVMIQGVEFLEHTHNFVAKSGIDNLITAGVTPV